ncbi:MAG: efflux RND transporter periplasmic adaptor subunit [Alphaproteobacteria bacterium]
MLRTLLKITGLLILAAAIWIGFSLYRGAVTVAVIHPVTGPAVQAVYATGTVEPSVMVPVAPRTPARLTALLADEGEEVAKGQVLAQLEDQELQKTLDDTQAAAALARKDYERKAALTARGAVSKEALDQAQAALASAEARAAQAHVNLDYLKLAAPEKGMILRRDGEVGQLIPASQPVFWMSCCAGLRVSAEVDEEDIASVKPGQAVLIRADAFPDQVFNGKVQSITPKGDPVSRSYRVRISLDADAPLLSGMTAEANIVIREEKEALLIPAPAVKNNAVWLVVDGLAEKRSITPGARTKDAVEVRSGVSASDIIVKEPKADIAAGQRVKTRLETWKVPQN